MKGRAKLVPHDLLAPFSRYKMQRSFALSPRMIPAAPVVSVLLVTAGLAAGLTGCTQVSTSNSVSDFQATAATTYTWQVEYIPRNAGPDRPNDRRIEKFDSTTVVNVNGVRPDAAGSGPDSKGLWWPVLPPEPTVDEIEDRRRKGETPRPPEVVKSTAFKMTFDRAGEEKTLPTGPTVYRQAVKAFEKERSLMLTLGAQDGSVVQAEIE